MGTDKPQVTPDLWGEGGPGEGNRGAGHPGRGYPGGQGVGRGIRASDAEREDALRVLADHYADGRLDRAEFDERADAAFAARTREQLRVLFRDLPRSATDLVQATDLVRTARPVRTAVGREARRARPPAPPILILPLLAAIGVVAILHGIPPFPLIPLFFLLTRGRRRWNRG